MLNKIKAEKDFHIIGDIIHILGGQRSIQASSLAHVYISHEDDYIREVCLYVVGWIGGVDDVNMLANMVLHDNSVKNRCTATTAMRQIYLRNKNLKQEVLSALKVIFEKNLEPLVTPWVIIVTAEVAGVDFGLKEKFDDPYQLIGDIAKAKAKATAFFSKL